MNDGHIYGEGFDHRRKGLQMRYANLDGQKFPSGFVLRVVQEKNIQRRATMKKIAIYAGLFAVLATPFVAMATTAAQSQVKAEANAVSIKGKVSCSRFGVGSITARKGMSVAQTIQYCVNFQGGDYTLVSGNQIYRLAGDTNMLAKMSGQTVAVAGRMSTDQPVNTAYVLMGTVEATSIAPAKN
jgi:hypothetical protein